METGGFDEKERHVVGVFLGLLEAAIGLVGLGGVAAVVFGVPNVSKLPGLVLAFLFIASVIVLCVGCAVFTKHLFGD